ncbi:putative U1 small nuclear ribonucleoprotein C [Blattamonas nauphoetae]|uniref:U1 small nuclear ribonucleoprotein C n=1 Tax=Blattamonas nauphoetae TaxID=2049346 RepID=A0ABQ9YM44_9EUKA|nr:putative U1 small nuclear ribonucleoprotein C [Blattamonas nauphoetae]
MTEPNKIHLGNLAHHVRSDDLKAAFERFGEIVNIELKRRYGFITFADSSSANEAASTMNGELLLGAPMRVDIARARIEDDVCRKEVGMAIGGTAATMMTEDAIVVADLDILHVNAIRTVVEAHVVIDEEDRLQDHIHDVGDTVRHDQDPTPDLATDITDVLTEEIEAEQDQPRESGTEAEAHGDGIEANLGTDQDLTEGETGAEVGALNEAKEAELPQSRGQINQSRDHRRVRREEVTSMSREEKREAQVNLEAVHLPTNIEGFFRDEQEHDMYNALISHQQFQCFAIMSLPSYGDNLLWFGLTNLMPKYYCDYCDAKLTHDSINVRRNHCNGKKHKLAVRKYYEQFLPLLKQQQSMNQPFPGIPPAMPQPFPQNMPLGLNPQMPMIPGQSNPQMPPMPNMPFFFPPNFFPGLPNQPGLLPTQQFPPGFPQVPISGMGAPGQPGLLPMPMMPMNPAMFSQPKPTDTSGQNQQAGLLPDPVQPVQPPPPPTS